MFQASPRLSAHKIHFVKIPQENCPEPKGIFPKKKKKKERKS
jgi:hypothetical protein